MENYLELASRIKELREVCGYSKERLAKELGITNELYSSYEENGEDIPISVLYNISYIFGVDFSEIVSGSEAKLSTYQVVRRGKGVPVERHPGYFFEDLAFRYSHKIMQPLLVTLEPNDLPAEPVSHSGQEFNLVLEGTMLIKLENEEITLYAGDSVYFNSKIPHSQRCLGDIKARFLTVITE